MNQRIEKFARECGAWNQVYADRTFMIDEHFDIEKFADMIVKDCADIADEYDGVGSTIVSRIQKHFEVES
jgi:hypothetical protein